MSFSLKSLPRFVEGVGGFVSKHPASSLALVAGGGASVLAGIAGYEDQPSASPGERASSAFKAAAIVGSVALAGTYIGTGLWHSLGAKGIVDMVGGATLATGRFVKNRAMGPVLKAEGRRAILKAGGHSAGKAAMFAYGGSARLMMGAGAIAGAGISAARGDDPIKGALWGAAAGASVPFLMGTPAAWRKLGPVPFARTGVVSALSLGVLGAGIAMAPDDPASVMSAENNGLGGYDTAEPEFDPEVGYQQSGVRRRMEMINATGSLAFALHGARR